MTASITDLNAPRPPRPTGLARSLSSDQRKATGVRGLLRGGERRRGLVDCSSPGREAVYEAIGAEHADDARVVAVCGQFGFGFAEIFRKLRDEVVLFGLHRQLPDPFEERSFDERLDDGAEHGAAVLAGAGGMMTTASVRPYTIAGSGAVSQRHLVRLDRVPAAGAAQDAGQQGGVTARRAGAGGACAALPGRPIDQWLVRVRVDVVSGARLAEVDAVGDDVDRGARAPRQLTVGADDLVLVEDLGEVVPRSARGPQLEQLPDHWGELGMRHQDAVLASDVAGRSLRGDVHATLDGTLPGGGPALCDAAPFHPGQGEHDRHREFAEDRGGVDAEVDDRESGALVVDVLDELESVADAGPGEAVEAGDCDPAGLPVVDPAQDRVEPGAGGACLRSGRGRSPSGRCGRRGVWPTLRCGLSGRRGR